MPHQSEIVHVAAASDGAIAVRVRCCGDQTTDSVLTIFELHRDNSEIDKDIAAHQARVEKLHEARSRAIEHMERLKKK